MTPKPENQLPPGRRKFEAQFMDWAIQTMTLIADCEGATIEHLDKYCARSKGRIEREVVWAVDKGFLQERSRNPEGLVVYAVNRSAWTPIFLRFIGRHGAATAGDLATRFGVSEKEVHEILPSMVGKKWLRMTRTLRAEPWLFVASYAGLRLTGLTHLKPCPVSSIQEGHLREVVKLAIAIELDRDSEFGPYHEVWSERELEAWNRGRVQLLACPTYKRKGERSLKVPDLFVLPEGRKGIRDWGYAVEMELHVKPLAEQISIFAAYKADQSVRKVIYWTPANRARWLRTRRSEAEAEAMCEIILLASSDVPAMRRLAYYRPQPMPCSKQRFAALDKKRWKNEFRFQAMEIVTWIVLNGAATADAVATRFGLDEADACEWLVLAHGAGLLHFSTMLQSEDAFFFATRDGIREAGFDPQHLEIDTMSESFYLLSAQLCRRARIGAELWREHPDREVKVRWELRADEFGGGEEVLTVAEPGSGVGERKRPDALAMALRESEDLPIAAVAEPYTMQGDKQKLILSSWNKSDKVAEVLFYAAYSAIRSMAKKILRDLRAEERIEVRKIPLPGVRSAISKKEAASSK